MGQPKQIKLTKSGKIDMRGKGERKNKLTTEEKKLKARLLCKKHHENNRGPGAARTLKHVPLSFQLQPRRAEATRIANRLIDAGAEVE